MSRSTPHTFVDLYVPSRTVLCRSLPVVAGTLLSAAVVTFAAGAGSPFVFLFAALASLVWWVGLLHRPTVEVSATTLTVTRGFRHQSVPMYLVSHVGMSRGTLLGVAVDELTVSLRPPGCALVEDALTVPWFRSPSRVSHHPNAVPAVVEQVNRSLRAVG